MDSWEKSFRDNKLQQERKNPSFSSTLLDAIYRSIDEGEDELALYRESITMREKQSSSVKANRMYEVDKENSCRASMIEKWMEKNVNEKVKVKKIQRDCSSFLLNSTSSSSNSSFDGGFSSSEAESIFGERSRSRSSGFSSHKPKPIRTSVSVKKPEISEKSSYFDHLRHQKKKNSVPEQKTKSRALKLYEELKKVKQPISPGGRVATFLNSLFTAGNAKKAKMSSSSSILGVDDLCSERKLKSAQASTCSSASSFSRSCLTKTPSSREKLSNGIKRSVRFYPVSVILDEDCKPCGHKSLYEDEPTLMAIRTLRNIDDEDLKLHVKEKNRRREEAARDLLKGFQKKSDFDMRDLRHDDEEEQEEEEDDSASCSSSDLFELDSLASIGIERYREELPVYESTHLTTKPPRHY